MVIEMPRCPTATGLFCKNIIIVEDAELEKLARERKFGTLLRHPVITDAIENPEVRKLVDELNF